jgi:TolA-binding protein
MMTRFRTRILVVAVLLAGTGLPSVGHAGFVNPDADRMFMVLSGAFQSGKHESSIAECRNFLRQFPRHPKGPSVQYIKAEAFFLQKRWPEAAAEYKEFIDGNRGPDSANLVVSARFRLGECHLHLKKYLTALDHFAWVEKSKNDVLGRKPCWDPLIAIWADGKANGRKGIS